LQLAQKANANLRYIQPGGMDEPDVDALLSEAETARIDFENSKQCLSRTKGHYDVRKGIVDV